MNKFYTTFVACIILCLAMTGKAQQAKSDIVPPYKDEEKAQQSKQVTKSTVDVNETLSSEFKNKYLAQVEKRARLEARLTAEVLQKRYKGDTTFSKILQKVIYDRIIAIETLSLDQNGTVSNHQLMKKVIVRADSIIERYTIAAKNKLMANGNILKESDNSKFGFAVRNRVQLKLSVPQVDSLINHSNRLANVKNKGQYPKDYERDILPRILTDEQYTQLLIIGCKNQAYTWALGDWEELTSRKLNGGLDKTKTIDAIYNYNLARLVKKERFGNAPPKVSASIKSLETPEPEALRIVRQARTYNNPIPAKAETVTKFTW